MAGSVPQQLVTNVQALLLRRAPQYKRWLQRLVELPSYTRDPADVRRQAQATADMFAEQLRYPLTAELVEAQAAHHGPHLILRSAVAPSPPGTASPPGHRCRAQPQQWADLALRRPRPRQMQSHRRPVVGMVSHLDTVYPREQLERDGFHWQDRSDSSDRVLGPGTMDIKGGTVLICMVLDALQTLAPER
jgi:acetylornithine deacetylase/succinyl-diaminopimelate desuccinylase-like protein